MQAERCSAIYLQTSHNHQATVKLLCKLYLFTFCSSFYDTQAFLLPFDRPIIIRANSLPVFLNPVFSSLKHPALLWRIYLVRWHPQYMLPHYYFLIWLCSLQLIWQRRKKRASQRHIDKPGMKWWARQIEIMNTPPELQREKAGMWDSVHEGTLINVEIY